MPIKIGSTEIPYHGNVYFFYDPLSRTFAASREDECPPSSFFKLTIAEALKLVEPKY